MSKPLQAFLNDAEALAFTVADGYRSGPLHEKAVSLRKRHPETLAAVTELIEAATDAVNILDGCPCQVDDPEAWREEVRQRLHKALRAAP